MITDRSLGIGELSRLTGVPVRTIRFYCDEGVLAVRRSSGGHRRFDPDAVERLRLVRRLRGLGLGLPAIANVLTGERSLDEAISAERAALDVELASLAWRRASLRAVEEASPAERAARLELLAHAQGPAARDVIVDFWMRMVRAYVSPEIMEGLVQLAVPDPPADPTPAQVVAFAEMVVMAHSHPFGNARRVRERIDQAEISDEGTLMRGVAEAYTLAIPALLAGEQPQPGPALDRFVEAHAHVRGDRKDTPEFRHYLHRELLLDQDPRIDRYWDLFTDVTGTFATFGRSHRWLLDALGKALEPA
ncbi:MerR family transcriptional regulator [Actinomadura rudentiformis]|uniref:MerR family transcriptional regulator n=1 Tax=Actinomadura rudentiformis TaxID=359158 RepID=A0A6H9YFX1_9ACTN|nr:MerR family transcriptional regulator [Actinomadura rudentiformis]KAB2343644.1 MerR family transcriptional regulator [Actinomadura rudentiformis]